MKLGGLQKVSLIDYPGKVSSVVFLSGCNFSCPWCHSPHLALNKKREEISQDDFFQFLEKRKDVIDGVVICGGEPTIHHDLSDFILKIKKQGFLIKIDTNGSNPDMLKELIDKKLVDYIAMDIKAPLNQNKYNISSGSFVNIENLKKSINLIKSSGIDYEFRTTIIPSIHNQKDIEQIAKDIGPAKRFFIQNFRPGGNINPQMANEKPYSLEFIEEITKNISDFFEEIHIR